MDTIEKAAYIENRKQIAKEVVEVLKRYGLDYGQAAITIKDVQELLSRASSQQLIQ